MRKDTNRKLREDLSPQERERAERIGSLPAGQKFVTAWSLRVEQYPGIGPKGRPA
jgi:hypothetical protein